MSEIIKRIDGHHETQTEMCDFGDGRGMRSVEFTTWVPTELTIRCTCGNVLVIQYNEDACSRCGRDHSRSGQELAPRSQWGYEFADGRGGDSYHDDDLQGFTDADYQMRAWAMEGR